MLVACAVPLPQVYFVHDIFVPGWRLQSLSLLPRPTTVRYTPYPGRDHYLCIRQVQVERGGQHECEGQPVGGDGGEGWRR